MEHPNETYEDYPEYANLRRTILGKPIRVAKYTWRTGGSGEIVYMDNPEFEIRNVEKEGDTALRYMYRLSSSKRQMSIDNYHIHKSKASRITFGSV